MKKKQKKLHNFNDTPGTRAFAVFNYIFLAIVAALCILPLINVLAISFSSSSAANANMVGLWPVDFTLQSYKIIFTRPDILGSFWISVERTVLGVVINLVLTVTMAYPLSKNAREFHGRNVYMALVLFVMLFSGGMVPLYMLVYKLNMLNTIWALILPGAVPIFNVVMMMNFFRGLPHEIEEAALVDGANVFRTLVRIVLPLSMPVIATVTLFQFVAHWNDWFSGLLYMSDMSKYPLQTLLQSTLSNVDITNLEQAKMYANVSDRTLRAAQIFVTTLPILALYPFLQKYFAKGVVLGAVKG